MFIYAIGFLAQGLFFARTFVQWLLSEKKREVVSPTIFWVLSLAGSVLLFTYGWLRDDFASCLEGHVLYHRYGTMLGAYGNR